MGRLIVDRSNRCPYRCGGAAASFDDGAVFETHDLIVMGGRAAGGSGRSIEQERENRHRGKKNEKSAEHDVDNQ